MLETAGEGEVVYIVLWLRVPSEGRRLGPGLKKQLCRRYVAEMTVIGRLFLFNNYYYDYVRYLNFICIHIMFIHYNFKTSRLRREIPYSCLLPLNLRTLCWLMCLPHSSKQNFLKIGVTCDSLINNSYMSIISQ